MKSDIALAVCFWSRAENGTKMGGFEPLLVYDYEHLHFLRRLCLLSEESRAMHRHELHWLVVVEIVASPRGHFR